MLKAHTGIRIDYEIPTKDSKDHDVVQTKRMLYKIILYAGSSLEEAIGASAISISRIFSNQNNF